MTGYSKTYAPVAVLFFVTLVLQVTTSAAASSPVILSKENFDQVTAGKTVLIKFYAPWCGHCQEMAPDWNKLAADWVDHPQLLVAEVDCTKEKKDEKWCQDEMNVDGFPTILYGDPSSQGVYLKELNERTYDAFSKFANEKLTKPFCSPGNVEACDSKVKKEIKGYLKMSESKLEKEIQKKEDAMKEFDKAFKVEFDKMQVKYEATAAHESNSIKLKANVKMLQAVKESMK
jgi:protein disulfide-isomerase-like protein